MSRRSAKELRDAFFKRQKSVSDAISATTVRNIKHQMIIGCSDVHNGNHNRILGTFGAQFDTIMLCTRTNMTTTVTEYNPFFAELLLLSDNDTRFQSLYTNTNMLFAKTELNWDTILCTPSVCGSRLLFQRFKNEYIATTSTCTDKVQVQFDIYDIATRRLRNMGINETGVLFPDCTLSTSWKTFTAQRRDIFYPTFIPGELVKEDELLLSTSNPSSSSENQDLFHFLVTPTSVYKVERTTSGITAESEGTEVGLYFRVFIRNIGDNGYSIVGKIPFYSPKLLTSLTSLNNINEVGDELLISVFDLSTLKSDAYVLHSGNFQDLSTFEDKHLLNYTDRCCYSVEYYRNPALNLKKNILTKCNSEYVKSKQDWYYTSVCLMKSCVNAAFPPTISALVHSTGHLQLHHQLSATNSNTKDVHREDNVSKQQNQKIPKSHRHTSPEAQGRKLERAVWIR